MVSCSTNCQIHSLGRIIFGCIVFCSVPLLHDGNICGQRDSVLHIYLPWRLFHCSCQFLYQLLGSHLVGAFVCRSSSSSTSSRTRFAVMMKPPYPSFTLVSQMYAYCVSSLEWCVPSPANAYLLSSDRFAIFPARFPVLFLFR